MKERPILMNAFSVNGILEGRKTMTRRVVKPQPSWVHDGWYFLHPKYDNGVGVHYFHTATISDSVREAWLKCCPYGQPGDRLWVRETWWWPGEEQVVYRATDEAVAKRVSNDIEMLIRWRPSIYMPRWASRIDLEITGVRVEGLQEITEEDAKAEGVRPGYYDGRHTFLSWKEDVPFEQMVTWGGNYRDGFAFLWDSINKAKHPWASNPSVWALCFRRVS